MLSNAIAEAKSTNKGWFAIGGDWNNRHISTALEIYPDLKILETPPTRKDRILDKIASNFNDFSKAVVCQPIEGKMGQVSDQKIVIMEALLPRPKEQKNITR